MRRGGAFLAALAFVVFLGIALLPTLSARPSLFPFVAMVICASLFIACEPGATRVLGIVALACALIAGVNLYQRNARFDARVKELVRQRGPTQ